MWIDDFINSHIIKHDELHIDEFDKLFFIPDKEAYINIVNSAMIYTDHSFNVTNKDTFRYKSASYPIIAGAFIKDDKLCIVPNILHYFSQKIKHNDDYITKYENICKDINQLYLNGRNDN